MFKGSDQPPSLRSLRMPTFQAQARTREAKKWLSETELSIEQIADKLQFSSANYTTTYL
ncbi:hypothetical protein GCM10008018_24870 [Paenibacillus marchantiophytorum]|uniref:Tyr recombinase domain-containing protein n=1 Tax=Paenibacillus marchantiophytorum TaxID=1619310 RepID=A0ABQ1EMH6_9BACL|nr:hypothetical protein GCM10008018_24870 [Paenibacillus marchantiophytorum]